MAQHFSIFSDVRLRASEKIRDFLQVLPKQYHFSRLKVLDLEGCKCVGTKNTSYLKDVCCNLLLLKYLNLRLLKLKRLLAGCIDDPTLPSVELPPALA